MQTDKFQKKRSRPRRKESEVFQGGERNVRGNFRAVKDARKKMVERLFLSVLAEKV